MSTIRRLGLIGACATLTAIALPVYVTTVRAETTPGLRISIPAGGLSATPGETLTLSVSAISDTFPNGVVIIAQDPIGVAGPVIGTPAQISLTIPTSTAPGSYSISAYGLDSTGNLIRSKPATLSVELSDAPMTISVQPVSMILRFVGDSSSIGVSGAFADGTTLMLNGSASLSITSNNTTIAIVQAGAIIGVGAGSTNINMQYGSLNASVPVSVPSAVPGDLNGDGKVDLTDLHILEAAIGTKPLVPQDARDLNHDGIINNLDFQILKTLCTYARCATHP